MGLFAGLAYTRMSPFWIFIAAKVDGGGGNNWSCKTYKAAVELSQPAPSVLQAGRRFCYPANSVVALKGIVHKVTVSHHRR